VFEDVFESVTEGEEGYEREPDAVKNLSSGSSHSGDGSRAAEGKKASRTPSPLQSS